MAAPRPPGRDAAEVDPNSDRLFVTRVPPTVTREDLQLHFSNFGTTTDVYLPCRPGFAGHKGIAFISFQEPSSLQLAVSLAPHEIHGQEVIVDYAAPRGDRGPQASQGPGKGQRWDVTPQPRPPTRAPVQVPPRFPLGSRPQEAYQPPQEPYQPPPPQGQAQASDVRLFVTKIPAALQKDMLLEHFVQFGELTDVYLPCLPGSASHKGIAFVSFLEPEAKQAAMENSPHEIQGHMVVVDHAAPRGDKAPRISQARPEQVRAAPRLVQPPPRMAQQPAQPAAPPPMVGTVAYESPYEHQPPVTHEPDPQMQAETTPLWTQPPLQQMPMDLEQQHQQQQQQQQQQQLQHQQQMVMLQQLQQLQQVQQQQPMVGYAVAAGEPMLYAAALPAPLPAPGRSGAPVPGRLFVTRVAPDMSRGDIQNYFEQFGELLDVFVPNGKGIAFVSFQDPAAAAGVLQARTHFVKEGQAVVVDQALERPSKGDKGAGKGGACAGGGYVGNQAQGNVYLGPPSRQAAVAAGADVASFGVGAWQLSAAVPTRFSPY